MWLCRRRLPVLATRGAAALVVTNMACVMARRGATQSSTTAVPRTIDEVRALLQRDEEAQARREAAVDARAVVFAAAASADHHPRLAAAEAFDMAAAALPRPPNFCYATLSADYAAMLDTPGVLWGSLCRANGVALDGHTASDHSSKGRAASLHMLGTAVSCQRPGGGYVQVMLGCVPDLQCDAFTLDTLPHVDELRGSDDDGTATTAATATPRPPPALCIALLDAALSLQYERVLVTRVATLAQRLRTLHCPLVGGVLPPLAAAARDDGNGNEDGGNRRDRSDSGDSSSLFFVNDRVYRGSAAAVVLRSRLLVARAHSVVPSIQMRAVTVDGVTVTDASATTTRAAAADTATAAAGGAADLTSSRVCVIARLDGRRATDVVRDVYACDELRDRQSKLFLGVRLSLDTTRRSDDNDDKDSKSSDDDSASAYLPLTFTGDPANGGTLRCLLPPAVQLRSGDTVALLVDDAELDSEAAAGLLVGAEQRLQPLAVTKDIVVAREVRRRVVASSTAALHFSCATLNVVARPDTPTLHLGGGGAAMYAPSVLHRCVGRSCANTGIFCPGQVATVSGVTGVLARSSTYAFLQGTA